VTKYYLTGVAQLANWGLAAVLAASAMGGAVIARTSPWLGVALFLAATFSLVGVIRRAPVAYLGLATFAFFGLAASMRNASFVAAAFDAVLLVVALYVRSRLVARVIDREGTPRATA
jgi:hypothetical protein